MAPVGLQQAVGIQRHARGGHLGLPPVRPQAEGIVAPLGQPRRPHGAVQGGERRFGQRIGRGLLQLAALRFRQQAIAIRRQRNARLGEPVLGRALRHQQARAIAGRCPHRGLERVTGAQRRFRIDGAEHHHHVARTVAGDPPGGVGNRRIAGIHRQQRQDVAVDARGLPEAHVMPGHGHEHQQPRQRQPAPAAQPALRPPRCVRLSQTGRPRRASGWPASRSWPRNAGG